MSTNSKKGVYNLGFEWLQECKSDNDLNIQENNNKHKYNKEKQENNNNNNNSTNDTKKEEKVREEEKINKKSSELRIWSQVSEIISNS